MNPDAQTPQLPAQAPEQLELAFRLDSPLRGRATDDRKIMLWSFFALGKEPVTRLPPYDDGVVKIQVLGTELGIATIYDKEILVYCLGLLKKKKENGEELSPKLTFHPNDFFRVTDNAPTKDAYERFKAALKRLDGTQIWTNIESGANGKDKSFKWLNQVEWNYRKKDGREIIRSVTVTLSEWLFNSVLRDEGLDLLTYEPTYFKLQPTERRLYEFVRGYLARHEAILIPLALLRKRLGIKDANVHKLKMRLGKIAETPKSRPGYGVRVLEREEAAHLGDGAVAAKGLRVDDLPALFWRAETAAATAPAPAAAHRILPGDHDGLLNDQVVEPVG